jgi:pimeloyl-ACP methyl ester carboxylesterase
MADPSLGFHESSTTVDDRSCRYIVAGEGHPVVFLHGWALSHRSYRAALRQLVRDGARVYAPALPGFGGTTPLPAAQRTLAGYADWVASFVEAVGVSTPISLIGHSFGGGVALQTAHDHPELVSRLVLVNSIGGSSWQANRTMRDRPWWDWGLHVTASAFSRQSLTRVLPVVASDAISNAARHPKVLWEVGRLAREANLEQQLAVLRRRRLPVFILWGREDRVIPLASTEALARFNSGAKLLTVPGDHNWLIADPDLFAELMTNVVGAFPQGGVDEGSQTA